MDVLTIVTNPRGNIVLHRPTSRGGGAAVGARGTALNDFDIAFERVSLEKKRIGSVSPVDIELSIAGPAEVQQASMAMGYDLIAVMSGQAMAGDNTGRNWHGLETQLVAAHTTDVPNTGAASMYSYLRGQVGARQDDGYVPNAAFTNRRDSDKVYTELIGLNFAHPDLRTPEPSARGVPIVVTPDLVANTAVVGEFNPSTIFIEVLREAVVEFSTEAYFAEGSTGMRIMVDGNVGIRNLNAFRKITNTQRTDES